MLISLACLFALFHLSWSTGKIPIHASSRPNALGQHIRTMMKYNFGQPNVNHHELLKRSSNLGQVDAVLIQGGSAYGSPVTVGNQTFHVVLDTGSIDFVVFSNLMGNQTFNFSHVLYDPLDSFTAVPTGQTFNITYGTGSASGIVFNDTIQIAGLVIENQAVEATVEIDSFLAQEFSFDGILGLCPLTHRNHITPGHALPAIQNLFFENAVQPAEKLFTASLTRPNETEGFFTFGFIDDELVGNNTIIFTPIVPDTVFWTVPTQFVSINGMQINNSNQAIIDTGTTLIYISDDLIPPIYEPIGGFFNDSIQAWVIPSNVSLSQIPTVVLPVDTHAITLTPQDIAFQQLDDDLIIGGIQPAGNMSVFLFGDAWLRNIYAIFDLADGNDTRFGFVTK